MKAQIRKIAMFGGTFAVALGIGFVMQNGDALASRFATEDELRAAQAQVQSRDAAGDFIVLDALPEHRVTRIEIAGANETPDIGPSLPQLEMPDVASLVGPVPAAMSRIDLPELPVRLAAVDPDMLPQAGVAPVLNDALDCDARLDATVTDAAMVELTLSAPCSIDARATIHHQGMLFTLFTDSAGEARVTVPALAETAVFIADISGSDGAMAMVQVPEVALYDRAVLQWQGNAGLELHAREFGAAYGSEGHVWHTAARDAGAATDAAGFLTRLGEPAAEEPLMAEVYTFPTGKVARDGEVILSAEIEITEANCGRDVYAQSLQMGPSMETTALDLTLTLPGCDASGDFLVLQNMFEDLKLAAR